MKCRVNDKGDTLNNMSETTHSAVETIVDIIILFFVI